MVVGREEERRRWRFAGGVAPEGWTRVGGDERPALLLSPRPGRGEIAAEPGAVVRAVAPAAIALGLGLLGLAALRDTGLWWLALEALLVVAAAALVVAGFAVLREAHARSALTRAWATLGAAVLLLVALVIGLD